MTCDCGSTNREFCLSLSITWTCVLARCNVYWILCTVVQWWLHEMETFHDDVIKWTHFPRYWPFVRGIHRSQVNSPHKDQWPGALMFSLIFVWINNWVNNREAGDLRRHRSHYDVTVMFRVTGPLWWDSTGPWFTWCTAWVNMKGTCENQ